MQLHQNCKHKHETVAVKIHPRNRRQMSKYEQKSMQKLQERKEEMISHKNYYVNIHHE